MSGIAIDRDRVPWQVTDLPIKRRNKNTPEDHHEKQNRHDQFLLKAEPDELCGPGQYSHVDSDQSWSCPLCSSGVILSISIFISIFMSMLSWSG